MHSVTNNGLIVRDNFSQLLIYEMMEVESLVDLEPRDKTWNFLIGEQHLVPGGCPDDTDTASLALVVLPRNPLQHER
ncbi:hypothetical protein EYB25_004164 [Talaromyces marneffei]|nr:hypothetical protein EYB25_004164 [Talaromyces marneffei]